MEFNFNFDRWLDRMQRPSELRKFTRNIINYPLDLLYLAKIKLKKLWKKSKRKKTSRLP